MNSADSANLLKEIIKTDWWPHVSQEFDDFVQSIAGSRLLVLYNADADGFCASYLLTAILRALTPDAQPAFVHRRAVWNYEYDFRWVSDDVQSICADAVICMDLPIHQEPQVLRTVGKNCRMWVYDHHMPRESRRSLPHTVTYVNSREIDTSKANHPSAGMLAALAHDRSVLHALECVLSTIGLLGDRALNRYPTLLRQLARVAPKLASDVKWNGPLGQTASLINAMFRASPGCTPQNAEERLHQLSKGDDPDRAISVFTREYELEKWRKKVTDDVSATIGVLRDRKTLRNDLMCKVVEMKTFSIGVVATRLSEQGCARVVVLGFKHEGRVQFELRTRDDSGVDLTRLLCEQRKEFQPITSGGHPKAAGALVSVAEIDEFCQTLRRAAERMAI